MADLTAQYLDAYNILVNEVVGSYILFIIIGVIVIMYMTLKAEMPFHIGLMLSVLFILICVSTTMNNLLYIMVVTLISIFFFIRIIKFYQKQ